MTIVNIYVDGSAINNENPNVPTLGGVGIGVWVQGEEGAHVYWNVKNDFVEDKVVSIPSGHIEAPVKLDLGSTTNNTTELAAIYGALEMIRISNWEFQGDKYIIHGDSEYAGNLIFGTWRAKANKELVAKTKSLLNDVRGLGIDVTWSHVRAHADNQYNNYVDYLAKSGAYNISPNEILTFSQFNNPIAA
tara:strand:- start:240 stop:809 length:570 start_codon:yes stop_codon:yes gene_type:complete